MTVPQPGHVGRWDHHYRGRRLGLGIRCTVLMISQQWQPFVDVSFHHVVRNWSHGHAQRVKALQELEVLFCFVYRQI